MPILERGATTNGFGPAVLALGRSKQDWAVDAVLKGLRESGLTQMACFQFGRALGQSGDKRAIPWLIAGIISDGEYATYGLGWFGLHKLTGVRYDKSHDGAWWLAWWDRNAKDLPAAIAANDPRGLVSQFIVGR